MSEKQGWSISSIWFVWLIGLEIHSEEPDRPERSANQTDEPERVARAQKIISLQPGAVLSPAPNALSWLRAARNGPVFIYILEVGAVEGFCSAGSTFSPEASIAWPRWSLT